MNESDQEFFESGSGTFKIQWTSDTREKAPFGSIAILFDGYNIVYRDWSQPMFLWSAANALEDLVGRPFTSESINLEKSSLAELIPLCNDTNRIWSTELYDGASRFLLGNSDTIVVISELWSDWGIIEKRLLLPWHLARASRQDMQSVVHSFTRYVKARLAKA